MPGPSVSVIIPCYNTGRYLAQTLESAVRQAYSGLEILVVDDGSTDGSGEIAAAFAGAGVRCLRQANAGISAARNTGVRATSGEFLVFLDADDLLLPGALELGARELASRPGVGFVYGFSRSIAADGRAMFSGQPEPVAGADYRLLLSGRGILPPAVAMFRRSAVERVGGFVTGLALAEDHDFYLRVAREFPIHCHNRLVAEYRHHENNACRQSPTRTLAAVLRAIDTQREWVRGRPELERASRQGRRHWRGIFGPHLAFELMGSLKRRRWRQAARAMAATLRHYPRGLFEYPAHRIASLMKPAVPVSPYRLTRIEPLGVPALGAALGPADTHQAHEQLLVEPVLAGLGAEVASDQGGLPPASLERQGHEEVRRP
jgi:glycosyltransferase involved in cell wall biosynthesis